ncbi:MAG: hypothetical protein JNM94_02040 [Phycisphaerae bacterium]|nr:hypothetical protein [Phycisphaerae bacterium]
MRVLPPALVYLTYLRFRATMRRVLAVLKTPRGILLALGATGFVCLWLIPPIMMGRHVGQTPFASLRDRATDLGPYVILGMLLLSLIRSPGEQALAFLQAEVDFLFPAPFTRRQLLLYKLAQRVLPFAGAACLSALWTYSVASSWFAAALGAFLIFWLIHLVGLCVALVSQSLEEARFRRMRILAIAAIGAMVIGGAIWVGKDLEGATPLEKLSSFRATTLGTLLAMPTYPFARAFTAKGVGMELLLWGGIAAAINVALVLLAILVNSNWLEAGADSSARVAARVEAFRRTGTINTGTAAFGSRTMPDFPTLWGIGPFAWRQAVSGMRMGPRSLIAVGVIGAVILAPSLLGGSWKSSFQPTSVFLVAYLSLFLPQMLRLDFRGDIDRFDTLKALPTPPLVLCIGQVLTPAVLITALQVPLALAVAVVNAVNPLLYAIWVVPLFAANVVLLAIDNTFFLYLPTRHSSGAGMQLNVGQMMAQVARLMTLAILLGIAALVGSLASWMTGWAHVTGALAATLVLLVEAAGVIVVMAGLFARFDPARDAAPE